MRTVAQETAFAIALRSCSGGSGELSIIYDFSGRQVRAFRHTFRQRLDASQEEQMSLLMIVVLF